jgi:hypothetical protein
MVTGCLLAAGGSSWFLRLVAWLLHLKQHGSGLWPLYIASLPQEADMACLLNFTPEERQELQDPELIALAEEVGVLDGWGGISIWGLGQAVVLSCGVCRDASVWYAMTQLWGQPQGRHKRGTAA